MRFQSVDNELRRWVLSKLVFEPLLGRARRRPPFPLARPRMASGSSDGDVVGRRLGGASGVEPG
jgi:hypothetical protein